MGGKWVRSWVGHLGVTQMDTDARPLLCSWSLRPDIPAPRVLCHQFISLPGLPGPQCPLTKSKGQGSAEQRNRRKWKLFGERQLWQIERVEKIPAQTKGGRTGCRRVSKRGLCLEPWDQQSADLFSIKRDVLFSNPPPLANNDKEEWLRSLLKWNSLRGIPSEWNVLSDILSCSLPTCCYFKLPTTGARVWAKYNIIPCNSCV